MWRYSEGRIEKSRLRASMRILLDRPELADLVIADLARWKDWEIQDRLMDIYISSITKVVPNTDAKLTEDEQKALENEFDELQKKASKLVDGKFPVTLDAQTADAFNVPSIKRAIVRYMLVSTKDIPDEATSGENSVVPKHVTKGRSYVEILRELDPKTVSQAERFFFLK
jgi:hypothetical protein